MTQSKSVFNDAAVPGLVLALVSIAYELLCYLGGKIDSAVLAGTLSVVLWIAKFVGCILLLRLFMKKYAAADSKVDNSQVFRFGVVAALYSAILYSAFYFAYTTYIVPDMFKDAMDQVVASMSSSLDQASLERVEELIPQMPLYSFIGKLIYCFLFGTVLSAILSRNIPSSNPFE